MFLEIDIVTLFLVFNLITWDLLWKGIALWVSAKENKKGWFFFLLVLNTLGVLQIIYFCFFSETGKKYFIQLRHRLHLKKKVKTSE